MKFHGRIAPGRLTKLSEVMEIIVHAPAKASGVTVKIWELAGHGNARGAAKKAGSDTLLATFKGDIESEPCPRGPRPPDWRRFKVSDAKIEEGEEHVARFKLRFAGDDTAYDVPIKSETEDAEAGLYEIGFSMELGGGEKFRTKSPCLVAPPRRAVRVTEARFGDYDDQGKPAPDTIDERPMALRYAAIGVADGDPEDAKTKLKILGNGHIDLHGFLVAHPDEHGDDHSVQAKATRCNRKVYIHVHTDPAPFSLGPSKIPIAVCDEIDERGRVRVEVPDRRSPWEAQFLEQPRDRAERHGRRRYTPGEPVDVESPADPHDRADPHEVIARIAGRFSGRA